jgi:CBS domain-containing protein
MAPTVTFTRAQLAGRPVAQAVAARGKELSPADTVATARRLLASHPVRLLPVLDGARYLGAVDRDSLADGVPADHTVGSLAAPLVPTAPSSTPVEDALALLDRKGGNRLVVVADDGVTYVGVVCLRRDRRRLCVDASIAPRKQPQPERTPAK